MAGTATLTSTTHGSPGRYTAMSTHSFALTSTSGGAVSGNAKTVSAGKLVQVQIVPGSGVTDLFDLTLLNAAGIDLLAGAGADLAAASAKMLICDPPVVLTTDLTIDAVLANAGNVKTVTVTLYVESFN